MRLIIAYMHVVNNKIIHTLTLTSVHAGYITCVTFTHKIWYWWPSSSFIAIHCQSLACRGSRTCISNTCCWYWEWYRIPADNGSNRFRMDHQLIIFCRTDMVEDNQSCDHDTRGFILYSKVEGWVIGCEVDIKRLVHFHTRCVIRWNSLDLSIVSYTSSSSTIYWRCLIYVSIEGTLAVQFDVAITKFKLYLHTDLRKPNSIHCPVDELCDQPVVLCTSFIPTDLYRLLTWCVWLLNPLCVLTPHSIRTMAGNGKGEGKGGADRGRK